MQQWSHFPKSYSLGLMDIPWQTVSSRSQLSAQAVDLWIISVPDWQPFHDQLYALLSPEETARANRFKFERHQQRFAIVRGVLRLILGQYLVEAPDQIPFTYASHGKPLLAEPLHDTHLKFNLSHSHELAVYAVTLNRAIGVDLEYLRPVQELEPLVKRFFSPQESAYFQNIAPELKPQAFFRGWTQKEAYLKAIGTGLSTPLDQVEVSLAPHGPAAILQAENNPSAHQQWQIVDFEPTENYVAALAIAKLSSTDLPAIAGYWLHPQDEFGPLPNLNLSEPTECGA